MPMPEVDGILSRQQVGATVDSIAEWQLPSGMVPWFPGGHADPWNHVEAAMALATGGGRPQGRGGPHRVGGLPRGGGGRGHESVRGGGGGDKMNPHTGGAPAPRGG